MRHVSPRERAWTTRRAGADGHRHDSPAAGTPGKTSRPERQHPSRQPHGRYRVEGRHDDHWTSPESGYVHDSGPRFARTAGVDAARDRARPHGAKSVAHAVISGKVDLG